MKPRYVAPLLLLTMLVGLLASPAVSRAQTSSTAIFNDRLALKINNLGAFNIGAFPTASGGSGPASWDLVYRWPLSPATSFSTVRVDNVDTRYSNATTLDAPRNVSSTENYSRKMVNGIEITQRLAIVANPQTGQPDVARIAYTARNTSSAAHSVGLRVMLDTEVNDNDGALFRPAGSANVVVNEQDFSQTSAIPDTMQVFADVSDTTHVVVATFKGGDINPPPDGLTLANWQRISRTDYNYTPVAGAQIGNDSAYAVYWYAANNVLNPGDQREFVTYYGVSALTTGTAPPLAIGLTGPATLQVQDQAYTPNPFDITATLKNSSAATATNVQATLNLPPGLTLVSGPVPATIGDIGAGAEIQVTWRVQAAPQTTQTTLTYGVQVSGGNVQTGTVTRDIVIPALVALTPPAAPPATTSWYTRPDSTLLRTMGCDARIANRSGIVSLLFGRPDNQQSGTTVVYGTRSFDGKRFYSIDTIEKAAQSWIDGFWRCNTANNPQIRIAFATNNNGTSVSFGHGAAWAEMINRLDIYAKPYQTLIREVNAGIDIEAGFGAPASTFSWINGYSSVNRRPYYNLGSCDGCPSKNYPLSSPSNGWTLEDIWNVSGGKAPGYVLPLLYREDGENAAQWQNLAQWALNTKQSQLPIAGVVTQYQACQPQSSTGAVRDGCDNPPRKNTPAQGWTQFWLALKQIDDTSIINLPSVATDVNWK